MDDCGNVFFMDLDQALSRLDDFEGYRGNTPIKENIIDRCFIAYEYSMFAVDEKLAFEKFVRENIDDLDSVEAARRIMLN